MKYGIDAGPSYTVPPWEVLEVLRRQHEHENASLEVAKVGQAFYHGLGLWEGINEFVGEMTRMLTQFTNDNVLVMAAWDPAQRALVREHLKRKGK